MVGFVNFKDNKNKCLQKWKKDVDPPWGNGVWALGCPLASLFYGSYNKEILMFLCRIGDTSLQVCRIFKRLKKGTEVKGSSK